MLNVQDVKDCPILKYHAKCSRCQGLSYSKISIKPSRLFFMNYFELENPLKTVDRLLNYPLI